MKLGWCGITALVGLVVAGAVSVFAVGAKENLEEGLPVTLESAYTIE